MINSTMPYPFCSLCPVRMLQLQQKEGATAVLLYILQYFLRTYDVRVCLSALSHEKRRKGGPLMGQRRAACCSLVGASELKMQAQRTLLRNLWPAGRFSIIVQQV